MPSSAAPRCRTVSSRVQLWLLRRTIARLTRRATSVLRGPVQPAPPAPLLESQVFWGAIGVATFFLGLFLSWALKDFRWALWFSWPAWGSAAAVATKYLPASTLVRHLVLVVAVFLIGVVLRQIDVKVTPHPEQAKATLPAPPAGKPKENGSVKEEASEANRPGPTHIRNQSQVSRQAPDDPKGSEGKTDNEANPVPIDPPVDRGIGLFRFAASPSATPHRMERVAERINALVAYLGSVGFTEVPQQGMQIVIREGSGLEPSGGCNMWTNQPIQNATVTYTDHLVDRFPEQIEEWYARCVFMYMATTPGDRHGESRSQVGVWVSIYFNASFHGIPTAVNPKNNWLSAIWDVRRKKGQKIADRMVFFLFRFAKEIEPRTEVTFDEFLGNAVRAGIQGVTRDDREAAEFFAIFKAHGKNLQ